MTDLLARLAGPNWEADFLHAALPPAIVPAALATGAGFGSPALRAKLGGRPSLVGAPRSFDSPRPAKASDEAAIAEMDEGEGQGECGREGGAVGVGVVATSAAAASAELVREQLEAVQVLLRGMQERMLKRDGELDGAERRARDETARATDKAREVDLAAARAGAVAV